MSALVFQPLCTPGGVELQTGMDTLLWIAELRREEGRRRKKRRWRRWRKWPEKKEKVVENEV